MVNMNTSLDLSLALNFPGVDQSLGVGLQIQGLRAEWEVISICCYDGLTFEC